MTREKERERERERRGRERGRGREDTNTGIQACRVGTRRARFAGFSGDPRSRLAVLARELLRKLEARWWCCFFFSSSSSSPASPFVSVLPKARATGGTCGRLDSRPMKRDVVHAPRRQLQRPARALPIARAPANTSAPTARNP